MPNGYTQGIYEGRDVSLREFLMTVGRGMTMAIMQRDEALDQPVKLRKISTYHQERLAEALAEQQRLLAMTFEESHRAARDEFEQRQAEHEEAARKDAELSARYDAMIEQVLGWTPEPEVDYVKTHALRYLRESKEFDCGSIYPPRPQRLSGSEWRAQKREENDRDIEYHKKEWNDEIERVAGFNERILAFHRSLPDA